MNTLKINQVVPDANQPRKYFAAEKMATLKDSIKKHGIMNPLIVQKEGSKYLLVDGERRYRAAVQLKLAEVPVQIISSKDPLSRLVEQFHIQEQHEEWSSAEKAMAVITIVEESGKTLKEVGEMLSSTPRELRRYTAFAKLMNKELFVERQCSTDNAESIAGLKLAVKNIKENVMGEAFTRQQENLLERTLIDMIGNKEIQQRGDYSKMKDSFRANPKLIEKFLKGGQSISEMFVGSKANAAASLRNLTFSCRYVMSNGNNFLRTKSVKMLPDEISAVKNANEVLEKIIKLVG